MSNADLKTHFFFITVKTHLLRGFIKQILLDQTFGGWFGGGGGLGLLEGTDPEPLSTFSAFITAAFVFLYKHGVREKDKGVFVQSTSLCLLRKLDHETQKRERSLSHC